ncbi:MAG: transglycosylase SLT domain-containing protein [Bacteroidota bacterium]
MSFLHKKIKQVWIAGPKYSLDQGKGFVLGLPVASKSLLDRFSWKKALIIGGILIVTNFLVIAWLNWPTTSSAPAIKRLYLLDEAGQYIANVEEFELKVKDVSRSLDIPPEWLMAVMYSESRFNPSVLNHRGSGATGLIQFMVPAVKDLNRRLGTSFYMSDIKRMSAIDQLDLVREYLQTMRERYGEYDSLTDLYLAILYPRAMENGQDYVLYAKPSKKYAQNIGLDEDHNGSVSVSDIDNRMKRVFPEAYMVEK